MTADFRYQRVQVMAWSKHAAPPQLTLVSRLKVPLVCNRPIIVRLPNVKENAKATN